jgi:hypothetical protein
LTSRFFARGLKARAFSGGAHGAAISSTQKPQRKIQMNKIMTALSMAAACFISTHAHAQKAALVQDIERPTAQSIVSAHCAQGPTAVCNLYTVPVGKILHVTQIGALVKNAQGQILQWPMSNFTSLFYAVENGYWLMTEKVDLYLPAGTQVKVQLNGGGGNADFLDASVFGTLSDQ